MLRKIFQFISWTAIVLVLAIIALFTFLEIKTQNGIKELKTTNFTTDVNPIQDMDSTRQLSITPLIDWHSEREDLKTEMGVSAYWPMVGLKP